jgi:hypothetical protein
MKLLVIQPEAPGQKPLEWWSEISQIGEITGVDMKLIASKEARIARIATALRSPFDVVIWSGHGDAGRLVTADGFISADWLACQLRQAPPSLVVLAACLSGQRDSALNSIAEIVSQAGINTIGMWVSVEDRAAIIYNVELVRALSTGNDVRTAHRVALQMMAMSVPSMAGSAFLLPGMANGYGKIYDRMDGMERRLDNVEGRLDCMHGKVDTVLRLMEQVVRGSDANHRASD